MQKARDAVKEEYELLEQAYRAVIDRIAREQ